MQVLARGAGWLEEEEGLAVLEAAVEGLVHLLQVRGSGGRASGLHG